jgi:eukaryotic-like serine/threonine-protein kinase
MTSSRRGELEESSPAVSSVASRLSDVSLRADAVTPGEVIDGKYVIDRVIGVGGVGVVVAAKHAHLDEHRVAIKFLRSDVRGNADIVARFSREAKAAVKIKSEHAVRVFDVGVSPTRGPYLVMEYLEGRDLGDALVAGEHFDIAASVGMIVQACEALAVSHLHGIVHRDIKPENLFLARREDGSEIVKVLDFGISKAALTGTVFGGDEGLIQTSSLMGSPLYMSPEQMRSTAHVDHRTDIWSLGVVLYELLTGQAPFQGLTITQVCAEVLERDPKPVQSLFPGAPPGLCAAVEQCLRKVPDQRFSNVAELALALAPYGGRAARVISERTSSILQASTPWRPSEAPVRSHDSSIPPPPRSPVIGGRSEDPTLPGIDGAEPSSPAPSNRRFRWPVALAAGTTLVVAFVIGYALNARRAPASAPVAVAVASAHALLLESEPPGARVEWAGKFLGETPLSARLPDGSQTIRVSKSGFSTEELSVTLSPGDTSTQRSHVTLRRLAPPPPTAVPAPPPSATTLATVARPAPPSLRAPIPAPVRRPATTAAPPGPAPAPEPPPSAAPADCNPPFYFEGQKKVFKPNCL